MTRLLTACAAACLAAGMLHDALAPIVVAGLVCLLAAVRSARSALGAAAASYAVATAGILVIAGGAVGPWWPAPLLGPLAALPFALPGLVHVGMRRRDGPVACDVAFVLSWLLVEAAWVHAAGFPPFRIGYAVAATPLAALAGIAGAGGVSAAAWLLALALARVPEIRGVRAAGRALVPLVAVVAAHLTLAAIPPEAASGTADVTEQRPIRLRVALVQSDVRSTDRELAAAWPEAHAALEARTVGMVRRAAAGGADLIVTPEGSLRTTISDPLELSLPRFPGAGPFAVLAGVLAEGPHGPRNAIVDLAAGSELRYVKRHPIPKREARFLPGDGADPIAFGALRIAPSICYDLLFAREVRRSAASSDLLVAVSDAAFAGRSALPFLHLGVARLRAAETGTPLLFVTATGPSAVLDGRGRVLARTDRLKPEILAWEVTLGRRAATPYARFGLEADGFVLAAWSLLLARRGVRPSRNIARRP